MLTCIVKPLAATSKASLDQSETKDRRGENETHCFADADARTAQMWGWGSSAASC